MVVHLCPFIEFGNVAKQIHLHIRIDMEKKNNNSKCRPVELLDRQNGMMGLSRAIPKCMLR